MWLWLVAALAALGLLAAAAVVGLQDRSTLPGSILSGVSNTFGSLGQFKSTGFVASVKDALGLIADRSPGARQGGQLINKPAKLASLEGRYRTYRDHNGAPNGRRGIRNRLIPPRAPPAAQPVPGGTPLQIADLFPELGTADATPSIGLVPVGLALPSAGPSTGGGFFAGPGPVFIGGGGVPGPTAVILPPPPVAGQPGPVAAVPEPTTWVMFIVGVAAIAHSLRRRAKKQRKSSVLSLLGEAAAV